MINLTPNVKYICSQYRKSLHDKKYSTKHVEMTVKI